VPDLSGKVAIVTGAGWGIGRGTALRLAHEGSAVVVSDVAAEEGLEGAHETVELLERDGGHGAVFEADAAEADDWRALTQFAEDTFGGVDVLVNNAGGAGSPTFPDAPPERWGRVLDVNLRGVMLGIQAVLAPMRRRGGGAIVNVSSVAGLLNEPYDAPEYAAAKAGVIHLTAALGALRERQNVSVTCICPDWVETEAVKRSVAAMSPEERASTVPGLVPVDEVAELIVGLARDDTLAGRVLVRWADEDGARLLPQERL
jgi:NAD(P)-dependent dehydrogenase (short-subunit alcohol dehydrogenase family)